MNSQKAQNRLLFAIAVIIYIIASSIYGFWDYENRKKEIIRNIDVKLYNCAAALKYILPDDFHDRATDEQAISVREDRTIARKLTNLVKDTGFKYTYTIIKKGSTLFFAASDIVADPKTKRGTFYFYPYEEADASFIQAFDQDLPTYKTVTDQWGTVRSVIVPQKSPGGIKYLACADYDISYVKGLLRKNLLRSLATVLCFILLSIPIILIYRRSYYEYLGDLAESSQKYRELANSLPQIVFEMNNSGMITFVNRNASDFFGYAQNEFQSGFNALQMLVPEDRERALANFQRRIRGERLSRQEYTAKRKDGSTFPIVIHANPVFSENKVVGLRGILIDVTERKQSEEALRNSEKRYRALFEKSTDAIFVVERQTGRFMDANAAALRLTGRTLSELKQLTSWEVTLDGLRERINIVNTSSATEDMGKVIYRRPDGSNRVAVLTTVNLDSEAVIGIARDITDELAMEDHLRQAQKMEAIGTLAGGIAHDFNNILSAILGYSELVLAELPAEDPLRVKLEAIYSSGERARDLVAQILAFSRKDDQVRSPVEMRLILKDALKLLRPAIPTTIDIRTRIMSKCHVLGDPSRIHQIIMNLCTNAYQAMLETGGSLDIALSKIHLADEAAARAQIPAGSYCKLMVADSGVGIPPANIERIFDPYFTTKEKGKGTGLGLAAVHGIVKSHGGAILVESKVGKGTKFEVYLPLTADSDDTEEQADSQIHGGNERILLVDDERDILEVEKEMLRNLGYAITAQDNASAALKLFTGQPEQFDLVITDMTMPNMTGDKLAGELRKIRSNIPIILCTGFSELIFKEKAESLGIKGFLMKPVTKKSLSNMIRTVLDKPER